MKKWFLSLLCAFWAFTFQAQEKEIFKDRNYVAVGEEFSHFDKDLKSWNTISLEAKLKQQSWTFLTRANVANRFADWGFAIEEEVYKTFESKDYLALNAGYSPSSIFYNYRFGAEFFNPFAKTWEHSVGLQYIRFQDSVSVTSATASLSKYYGSNLTILRVTGGYQNLSSLSTLSGSLQQRYYHDDNVYSFLVLGYGYDPSSILFNNNDSLTVVKNTTFNAGLGTFQQLGENWFLQGQVGYQWFDFGATQRNQFSYSLKSFFTW